MSHREGKYTEKWPCKKEKRKGGGEGRRGGVGEGRRGGRGKMLAGIYGDTCLSWAIIAAVL